MPPQNKSRTCPSCGHVSAANRQTQAQFEDVACGLQDNADLVGAINAVFTTIEQGLVLRVMGHLSAADIETLREVVGDVIG